MNTEDSMPDLSRARIITDNAEAIAFLISENALSGLQPDPPYDTINAFWQSEDTHTHCFASYSKVPGDTGYVVIQFPFEFFTKAQAEAWSQLLSDANNLCPGLTETYYEDLAHPNN